MLMAELPLPARPEFSLVHEVGSPLHERLRIVIDMSIKTEISKTQK